MNNLVGCKVKLAAKVTNGKFRRRIIRTKRCERHRNQLNEKKLRRTRTEFRNGIYSV